MIDIAKQKVKINCPQCKSKFEVTMKQVADEATVSCSCGQRMKLQDKNSFAKNTIRDMNKTFNDLNKALKDYKR